jgi:hypothetical protein
MDCPAMDGRVVNGDAALRHHLLQVPEAETVGQIPAYAKQEYGLIEMPTLEHATTPSPNRGNSS